MAVVGFVTKSGGSNFFSQASGNLSNTGGSAYIVRKPDGTSLGGYRSAGQALNAFRSLHGGNRVYQLRRRDLPSRVEHYEIISDPPSPNEIFPPSAQYPQGQLSFWMEPQFNTKIILSPPAGSSKVAQITSMTSKKDGGFVLISNPSVINQGNLSPNDEEFNERDVLNTDAFVPQGYVTQNLTVNSTVVGDIAPPYSIFICCNHTSTVAITAGAAAVSVNSAALAIGDQAGTGDWSANNGALISSVIPISTSVPDIVLFEQTASGGTLWVNGTEVGSNIAVPATGGPLEIAQNPDPWRGKFAHVSLIAGVPTPSERELMFRYLREEFTS